MHEELPFPHFAPYGVSKGGLGASFAMIRSSGAMGVTSV